MIFKSSKYPNLGFYVDGHFKEFHKGIYPTEDEKEIEILKSLEDVQIDETQDNIQTETDTNNSNSKGTGKK